MTVTVDCGANDIYFYLTTAIDFTGYDTSTPIGATATGGSSGSTGLGIDGAVSITLSGAPASDSYVIGLLWQDYGTAGTNNVAPGSGWTELYDFRGSDNYEGVQLQERTGSTSTTVGWDDIKNGTCIVAKTTALAFEVKAAAGAQLEQEGFRFGVDDGSESAHTWAAAQDANLTAPLDTNTLLRVLVDATNDPASAAYTLRYQKGGSGGYVAVPVVASVTTSPPQVTSATVQSITTANSSWALTNGRPAASTGDMIVAVVAWDDSTTVSSVTPPAGPNSESAVSIAGPQASASTEMRMQAWYWIATGSWTLGNWTYTPSASETCRQAAFVIPAGQFNAADPIGWANTRASDATNESTLRSPTGTAEADDGSGRLFIAYGSDVDAITAPASGTTTVDNGTTGGVGLCIVSRDTTVTNSESIAEITASMASDSWASIGFVVKPAVVSNELYISPSANIAAGGEATTARLTAPSGKTTSDFVTGRRWDDENGTDSIDITADDYTEVEWCLRAQSPAETDDYYEFRVYAGSTALDTYTLTPKWTIGSGNPTETLTEAVTADQSFTTTAAFASSVTESATVGDSYAVALTLPTVFSESVTLGDAFAGGAVQSATIAEAVALGESAAVAATFAASLAESATLADAYTSVAVMPAAFSESVTLADASSPALTINVTLVDSATLGDGVTTGTIYNDTLGEAISAADAYAAVLTISVTVSESVTAADAYASVAVMAAAITEAFTPADACGVGAIFPAALGESTTLGDIYPDSHSQSETDVLTDSVTVADDYAAQAAFAASLVESASFGDAFTAELVIPVALAESVSLADAYASARLVTADLDESVAMADAVASVLQAITTLAEDVTLDGSMLGTVAGTLTVDLPHTRRVGPRVMSFGVTRIGERRMSFGSARIGPRRMQFGVRRIGPRTIKGD